MTTDAMEGLMAAVPAEPRSAGPAWLVGLREEAAAHLRDAGFPGRKHEKWRFTSVREVVDTPFETAFADPAAARAWVDERLGDDGTWRLVLADGRPDLEGAGPPPEGVRVRSLAEVLASEPALVEPVLGQLVPTEHFAALSSALFEDGAVVVVDGAPDRPVHLVHVATPGETPRAAYPRVVVLAQDGSEGTLVESFLTRPGEGKHLTNAVAEVSVGADARLEHVRVTEGEPHAMQLAYLAASLDRDAFYGSRIVALGGAPSRLELTVRFEGPGAEAALDGAYHVDGREHVDHQVLVEHAAPHCTSQVTYRGLLDGRGHAVFNAMGVVKRDAQRSSVHQENRNLLLSDDATIDTKPHLEIDADDISASHGAAVGAVDDASLFYLRSRGIPEPQARDILTFAFVSELLERLPHAPLVDRTSEAVLTRLPHGDVIRELSS